MNQLITEISIARNMMKNIFEKKLICFNCITMSTTMKNNHNNSKLMEGIIIETKKNNLKENYRNKLSLDYYSSNDSLFNRSKIEDIF